jgi:large repetitive protein
VTGTKWNDINGNGLRDTSEPGVGDVHFFFDLDGDERLDLGEPNVKSKADGTFLLPNIGAGTFTIREVVQPGWVQTFPGASGDFGYTVTLSGNAAIDSQVLVGLDFGNQLRADFGDAPATYGSASAGFVDGLTLGTAWDAESAPPFSADATGDDSSNLSDEDGVLLTQPLVRGSSNNLLAVTTTNTTGQAAHLNVWMDFNGNGTFETSEKIDPAKFAIPSTAALGPVFARVRYGFQQNVGPTGFSSSGEVEDYRFIIVNTANIAVDDTDTVARNGSKIINVLANDFAAPGEVLRVVSTSGTTAAGGSAVPTADGAGVFYTTPQGFIGRDSFQYTVENSKGIRAIATVVIDVSLFFENPVTVDDSFDLPTNSIDYPLNVLANDIEGQNGALTIISVVQPDKGGQITIETGGKSLRYSPPRDFGGTEFVTYTVSDSAGNRSSATVTLHTLPGDRTDDQVQIRLEAIDISTGATISQVEQGKEFKIRVYVDDLRHSTADPGTASGVFSAYFDLLYNLQLVSTKAVNDPTSRFNFEVNFLNDYTAFTTGDGSIPGIVNEFGATSTNFNMQQPNELALAEITFMARSPGVVSFNPDPADIFPRSDTLLFNVPGSSVPLERIRFVGTQVQIFGDGVQFPIAVDDSAKPFAVNSVRNEIRVMDNDITGSTGSIQIASVTQGARGFVAIDGKGTTTKLDDVVTYTPATGFSGFDQFTYTIQDARGIQSTATVTVHVGIPGSNSPDSDDIISYQLVPTNLSGVPITEITVGQSFQLRAFVQDVRSASPTAGRDTRGVFSAYADVLFPRNIVAPVVSSTNVPNLGFTVSFGPLYNQVREGDIRTPGLFNEIGAVATFDTPEPSASNPQGYLDRRIPLFTITMTAERAGLAQFFTDPVDIVPLHESLTFNPAQTVAPNNIHFGFAELNVVGGSGEGEFHNSKNGLDVNNDGRTTPIDALLIINKLNAGEGGLLTGGSGEGEDTSRIFPDTNNDGRLTPIDALLVINKLNSKAQGTGEGESSLAAAPAVQGNNSGLQAEGESSASGDAFVGGVAGRPIGGPDAAGSYFGGLVDSSQNRSDDNDEDESFLDDLASDIDLNWFGRTR